MEYWLNLLINALALIYGLHLLALSLKYSKPRLTVFSILCCPPQRSRSVQVINYIDKLFHYTSASKTMIKYQITSQLENSKFPRPIVKGKFIFVNGKKFYIKGVTYGTFAPDAEGYQFPPADVLQKDFAMMSANGINCIRTYTVPSTTFLNLAHTHNLKVMVGLPWEQHIAFLDDKSARKNIIGRVSDFINQCKGHPAILCFTIGNEIPAGIVRWHGKGKVEKFLRQLYMAVKNIDPESLVTYVNYPTTEYLDLSFLDFDCFNVYLETPEKLRKYLARLHNLCGDRPLVLAEIGLDSLRNGEEKQAVVLDWQIKKIFAGGAAGMFVFAWSDEWWRGGFYIQDWDFGMVDRERNPKPALNAVSQAFNQVPFAPVTYPFISIIICSYNGSATIRDTLEGVLTLDYPQFEVIVVNDGSKDSLEEIVKSYPVKLITTTNKGLSAARNTGMHEAKGEIIAYIDDDAYPDPDWLKYLAYAYENSEHACIGGPNVAPSDDGFLATCVANAPGGPVHVLLTDEIAEHVPGCNMTFKKDALLAIGGFDPIYRNAGDDVDVCWRIQASGRTIGFHPSALVWHHRRNSFTAYWKQQKGYGKAEALLEAKWPEKYNGFGHLSWSGKIYGNGFTLPIKLNKDRVFHGTWGSALFQSVYQPADRFLNSIPLMPEWYLFSALAGVLGVLGLIWPPLLWAWTFFGASLVIVLIQAATSASKNSSLSPEQKEDFRYKLMIMFLHVIQPVARLYGRLKHGLTPWRKRGAGLSSKFIFLFGSRIFTCWSEDWRPPEEWLSLIEKKLIEVKSRVRRGGDFERFDLQVRNGIFAKTRGLLTIEEYGGQKQLLKFRCKAHYSLGAWIIPGFILLSGILTAIENIWIATAIFGGLEILLTYRFIMETGSAMNSLYVAFKSLEDKKTIPFDAFKKTQNSTIELIDSQPALTADYDLQADMTFPVSTGEKHS